VTVPSRYRWFVVAVFFIFMLLHQSDQLLIGPLTTPIMNEFRINEEQMGRVFTGALIVGAVFYPLWGYLYDRYARAKLLALASLIWGSTTWLNAVVRTYPAFLVTRATTGIDNSSYPGLFSLISDYFGPHVRGKVYGLLQLTQPLGFLLGTLLALSLREVAGVGWRGVFYLTGAMGVLVAVLIFFSVREAPRGGSEPELANLEQVGVYRFNWKIVRQLFRKRSLLLLFAQGFFGVFPWNVIASWFFRYLETERHYDADAVFVTMVPAVLVLAAGYFIGGALGDYLFKRTPRGRLIVSTVAVLIGAILMPLALSVPVENQGLFLVMLCLTAVFIPFSAANVISTVYDISLPEVRSTAIAVESFIESTGPALAPWLAGAIAVGSSLQNAILVICVSAWLICAVFLALAAYLVPRDIAVLRAQLRERAEREQRMAIG